MVTKISKKAHSAKKSGRIFPTPAHMPELNATFTTLIMAFTTAKCRI